MVILKEGVDGDIGFEPMNTTTKTWCLTAWRIPKMNFKKLVAGVRLELTTFGL